MRIRSLILATVLAAALNQSGTVLGQNPRVLGEDDPITISGKVLIVQRDSFTIAYPAGEIRIDVDEWNWRTHRLTPGERVIVRGTIDDGLFRSKTIEARSVQVPDRGIVYYAKVEDLDNIFQFDSGPLVAGEDTVVSVGGIVTRIDGREFTLRAGDLAMSVDTDELSDNPLDDAGFQQIDIGDRVRVIGRIDRDFFENEEIKATGILSFLPIPASEIVQGAP